MAKALTQHTIENNYYARARSVAAQVHPLLGSRETAVQLIGFGMTEDKLSCIESTLPDKFREPTDHELVGMARAYENYDLLLTRLFQWPVWIELTEISENCLDPKVDFSGSGL